MVDIFIASNLIVVMLREQDEDDITDDVMSYLLSLLVVNILFSILKFVFFVLSLDNVLSDARSI